MTITQTSIMAATIRASNQGLAEVDKSRRKQGWKKTEKAWAGLALTSPATLRRFWAGVAIQTETFKLICETVGITDWESVADLSEQDELQCKAYTKRLHFAIVGSIEDIDKQKLDTIVALLNKLGGDTTIEILDVDEGSIKLILGGSPEALQRIEALFKAGELKELSGVSVNDVHFLQKEELALLIKRNGGAALNLSGTNLSGVSLSSTTLSDANLSGANLSGTDLSRANLSGTDLSFARLIGADLSFTRLNGVNLNGANLGVARLSRANLSFARLNDANLSFANLDGVNLTGANLNGARLSRADLSFATLNGADLNDADLSFANLSFANLGVANLSRTNPIGARFGNNLGLSEQDKSDMQTRGAIFQDSPESDVPSLVRR